MPGCNSNKRAGRAYQSFMAKRLGGENVGTLGGEDIKHPYLSVELKKRKSFVGESFMAQAERNAPSTKTPVCIVHVTGRSHDKDIVMIRLKEWEEWFGRLILHKYEEMKPEV